MAVIENGISKDDPSSERYFEGRYIVPHDKGGESDAADGWMPNYWVPTEYFIDWSEWSVNRMKTLTMADLYRSKGLDHKVQPPHETKLPSRFQNSDFYFKSGATLSHTGAYSPMFRYNNPTPFNVGGSCIFTEWNLATFLAVACSKLTRFNFKCFINGSVNASEDPIKEIPFYTCFSKGIFSRLVAKIIEQQKTNPRYDYASNEQLEIDRLVYEAYGLNEDDIQEVENWYARRYPVLAAAQKVNLKKS
ncbi:MAG: Uncharacterised protein [Gammaproteobacteria bacterium]|nr:MAG: Uncharacterised protein [Gammaproteobacteria bacterium]